jgi:hypothetical protein
MSRYKIEPHEIQGPFSEKGEGEGPALESIETTYTDEGEDIFYCSGYGAREIAQLHQKENGGTIYVNSVSRKIVRKEFDLATNAPVYYGVAASPIYSLIRKDGKVVRAYWPKLVE